MDKMERAKIDVGTGPTKNEVVIDTENCNITEWKKVGKDCWMEPRSEFKSTMRRVGYHWYFRDGWRSLDPIIRLQ